MRSSGSCRRHPSSCVRRSSSLRKPPGDASTTLSSRNHPERFSSETQRKSTSPEVLPLPPLTPAPVSFKFPQVPPGSSRFLQDQEVGQLLHLTYPGGKDTLQAAAGLWLLGFFLLSLQSVCSLSATLTQFAT